MSLINEALKKAQRERTPHDATHGADAGASSRTGVSGRSAPSLKIILAIVVGGAVLVSASVFGTIYLLRKPVSSISIQGETRALAKEAETGQVQSQAQRSSSDAKAAQSSETPGALSLPGSNPSAEPRSIQLSVPSAANPQNQAPSIATKTTSVDGRVAASPGLAASSGSAATPVVTGKSMAKMIADSSSAHMPQAAASIPDGPLSQAAPPLPDAASIAHSTQTAAAHTAPSEPVQRTQATEADMPTKSHPPSPAAQAFVNQLKVNGIRASGADSKVLINDRVYRLNDLIDPALGLRLTEVSTDRLVFRDVHGTVYVRNF